MVYLGCTMLMKELKNEGIKKYGTGVVQVKCLNIK
jgi:hypothetical protein